MFRKLTRAKKILLLLLLFEFLLNPLATNALNFRASGFGDQSKPLILVIVDSKVYQAIARSLGLYKMDVEDEGYSVIIYETNGLSDRTPKGIRSFLKEMMSQGLTGVLFVGDIPGVWYEVENKKFVTDMYYADLDGLWADFDGNGFYDAHSGDVIPEVWVGRLKASTLACTKNEEIQLLNNYFNKNHRYRSGLRVLPWWRTLAYIDDDGVDWIEDVQVSLSQVSSDIALISDPNITTAEDFKTRLKDSSGFEWLYLMSHGSYDYHNFKVNGELSGGTVFSWEYRAIDPRILFYLFFTCSAARYTEHDYLAGSAVFADTYGLLAIGCTDSMFSVSFKKFFIALSDGDSIGNAFLKWFREQSTRLNPLVFYGLTIIGDPTLRPYVERKLNFHDISITNVNLCFQDTQEGEILFISVGIENKGNFTEFFNFTILACSLRLASSQLLLSAASRIIVNYTITKPYSIVFINSSKTILAISVDDLPEEFDLSDNLKQVCLEGVVIIKPEAKFSPHILESLIGIFLLTAIAVYVFFKIITSDTIFRLKHWMKGFRTFST
jgi:hypothetical protein